MNWRRQAVMDAPMLMLLAVLVALTALVGSAVPRMMDAAQSAALADAVATASPAQRQITASWSGAVWLPQEARDVLIGDALARHGLGEPDASAQLEGAAGTGGPDMTASGMAASDSWAGPLWTVLEHTGQLMRGAVDQPLRDHTGPALISASTGAFGGPQGYLVTPVGMDNVRSWPLEPIFQAHSGIDSRTLWLDGASPSPVPQVVQTVTELPEEYFGAMGPMPVIEQVDVLVFEVAIADTMAGNLGMGVGDSFVISTGMVEDLNWRRELINNNYEWVADQISRHSTTITARISGVFADVHGDADAWGTVRTPFASRLRLSWQADILGEVLVLLVQPALADTLQDMAQGLDVVWVFPVDIAGVLPADVGLAGQAALTARSIDITPADALRALDAAAGGSGAGSGVGESDGAEVGLGHSDDGGIGSPSADAGGTWLSDNSQVRTIASTSVMTAIPQLLAGHLAAVASVQASTAVISLGLAAIAATTIGMAVSLLTSRRSRAINLARARGASIRQLWVAMVPVTAAVCSLAAALGLLAGGLLVPGQQWTTPAVLAAASCLLAVVVSAAFSLNHYRVTDPARSRQAAYGRLWTVLAQILLVLVAGLGLLVLYRRGLAAAYPSAGSLAGHSGSGGLSGPGGSGGLGGMGGGQGPPGGLGTFSSQGAGVDPLVALVPVALALAAAVIALRLAKLPTSLSARAAGRSRGAALFVGLTGAARANRGGASDRTGASAGGSAGAGASASAAALVVVTAVAFSVFASSLTTTITQGQDQASWSLAGADLVVTGQGVNAQMADQLAAQPGVTAVLPVIRWDQSIYQAPTSAASDAYVTVYALDLAAYAQARSARSLAAGQQLELLDQLVAELAAQPVTAGASVPVLTAQDSGLVTHAPTVLTLGRQGASLPTRPVGDSLAVPTAGEANSIVMLPLDAVMASLTPAAWQASLEEASQALLVFTPDALLASQLADQLRVDHVSVDPDRQNVIPVDGVDVTSRYELVRTLHQAPLVRGAMSIINLGMLASGALGMVAIVLGLMARAPARAAQLSILRTLGMKPRQAAGMLAVEVIPLMAVALASGLATGLALLPIISPGVDLRPFTAGTAMPQLTIMPAGLLALVGVSALLVTLAITAAVALDRKRQLGASLRVGEST